MSRLYSGSEIGQGYAGDEDNGETSAWWLFSAMGFYPLQMGEGHYAVGSPLFTKMAVHLDNGKTLTINAPNNSAKNIYVTGLSVNGVARDQAWIDRDDRERRHSDVHDGLRAHLVGHRTAAAVHHDRRPAADPARRPHRVRTGAGVGVGSAAALTDNTSLTETTLPTGQAVTYRFVAPKNAVQQYTLTSGAAAALPPPGGSRRPTTARPGRRSTPAATRPSTGGCRPARSRSRTPVSTSPTG